MHTTGRVATLRPDATVCRQRVDGRLFCMKSARYYDVDGEAASRTSEGA